MACGTSKSNSSIVSKSIADAINEGQGTRPRTPAQTSNIEVPIVVAREQIPSTRPCQTCRSSASVSARDVQADQIFDHTRENLREAEKALANLGEHFEHDLKRMFVDITTKVQHWVSVVQKRIDASKADTEALHRDAIARATDSATRDRELTKLKQKLADVEARNSGTTTATQTRSTQPTCRPQMRDSAAEAVTCNADAATNTRNMTNLWNRIDATNRMNAVEPVNTIFRSCSKTNAEKCGRTRPSSCSYAVEGCGRNKEKARRETELEVKLARLQKENEMIMKERAEYEIAIQRALLKGVSSLNVETLKVLRCSPISCSSPGIERPSSSTSREIIRNYSPQSISESANRTKTHGITSAIPKNDSRTHSRFENIDPASAYRHAISNIRNNDRNANDMVFLLPRGDSGSFFRAHRASVVQSHAESRTMERCRGGRKCATPSPKTSNPNNGGSEMRSARLRESIGANTRGRRASTFVVSKRYRSCNKN